MTDDTAFLSAFGLGIGCDWLERERVAEASGVVDGDDCTAAA